MGNVDEINPFFKVRRMSFSDFLKGKYLFFLILNKNNVVVQGLTEELNIHYMYNYFTENDDNLLIVTSSMFEANKFFQMMKLMKLLDMLIY